MTTKIINHKYGNCACGKYHPPPHPNAVKASPKRTIREDVVALSTRDNPLWSPFRTLAIWFIEAFVFSIVFGYILQNSTPSLTGAALGAYFLVRIVTAVAKDFYGRFRERVRKYRNRNQ